MRQRSRGARISPRRFLGLTSALAAAVLLGLAGTPVVAQAETTVYRGAFACADGKPLAGARVELWQQHVRWLPRLPPNYVLRNVTRADDNGAWGFTVRGDETNWVVRVVLVGEDAAIQDWPWPWNFFAETLRSQNDRPLRDYGTQAIPGYQCDLYTAFTAAGREYRTSVGSAPPQGATLVRAGAPTAGVPFAPYDEVWWPTGRPPIDSSGSSTAQHEFAHVFRHIFDGDRLHFFADAAAFWYLRNHKAESCETTNSAFAFNEGWAEFWAGKVMAYCTDRTTGLIERNVAAKLKELQETCALPRARMVQVLIQNPRGIHSIADYERALNCTPPVRRLGRAKPRKPVGDLLRERRAVLTEGRRLVASLGRSVVRLDRDRRAAERLEGRPVPCPAQPCEDRLARRLAPVLLAGQVEQARALRRRFAFLADRGAVRELLALRPSRQLGRLERTRKAAVAESARIAVRSLRLVRRTAQRSGADAGGLAVLARMQTAAGRSTGEGLTGFSPIPPVEAKAVGPTPEPPGEAAPPPVEPPPPVPPPGPGPAPAPGPPLPPAPRSDLVVDRVYLTNDPRWEWNVDVRNAGAGAAPASRTGLTSPAFDDTLETPPLAAGQSVTLKRECPYGQLGQATARADVTGIVDESDETNNQASGSGGTAGRCRYP